MRTAFASWPSRPYEPADGAFVSNAPDFTDFSDGSDLRLLICYCRPSILMPYGFDQPLIEELAAFI
jgi:hypothetical protein